MIAAVQADDFAADQKNFGVSTVTNVIDGEPGAAQFCESET
jgi:hypothetical protein